MRNAIDTNIFVSAALKANSLPTHALSLASRGAMLLKSEVTERQLFDEIARPYFDGLITATTRDWLRNVFAAAQLVTITEKIAVCRDPTDDKFLELAIKGRTNLIISGDNDLLILHPFRGIPIIAPSIFVQNFMPRSD